MHASVELCVDLYIYICIHICMCTYTSSELYIYCLYSLFFILFFVYICYFHNATITANQTINDASEVPKIFTDNRINVSSGVGGIKLSPMSGGGKKSKKTKNKRKIRKQKGGFEYSGKSKRRRFSVTRSSSSPRSSQQSRSSSQRSSYETQSMVPPKYRARGSKKSKM